MTTTVDRNTTRPAEILDGVRELAPRISRGSTRSAGPALLDLPELRRLTQRIAVGFPLGHVHDVINAHAEPSVSVHAYSPPLTAMSYYRVEPGGLLRRTRSELTEHPAVAV